MLEVLQSYINCCAMHKRCHCFCTVHCSWNVVPLTSRLALSQCTHNASQTVENGMFYKTCVHLLAPLATKRINAAKRRVWRGVIEVLSRRNFHEAYRRREELQQGSTADTPFHKPAVTALALTYSRHSLSFMSILEGNLLLHSRAAMGTPITASNVPLLLSLDCHKASFRS